MDTKKRGPVACSHQPSILDQIETYDMQNIIVSIHSTAETEKTVTSYDVSASIAQSQVFPSWFDWDCRRHRTPPPQWVWRLPWRTGGWWPILARSRLSPRVPPLRGLHPKWCRRHRSRYARSGQTPAHTVVQFRACCRAMPGHCRRISLFHRSRVFPFSRWSASDPDRSGSGWRCRFSRPTPDRWCRSVQRYR